MAIIAPPPCMVPHALTVEAEHYDSVTVRWQTPVGVEYCRLEYGPEGFAPGTGTGTVIDSIFADSCRIGGLQEVSSYDVYVSGWCIYDSSFSDYVDTSFTTPERCNSKFEIIRSEASDSAFTIVWQLPADASFSEALYGPIGFDLDDGTLVSPILPDNAHRCTLSVSGLNPSTSYEIRIRNWCPYSETLSVWQSAYAATTAYYTVTAVPNNPDWGSVTGGGYYQVGAQATLTATPANEHCHFNVWNDGVTSRIRIVTVTDDITYTAIFTCDTCTESVEEAADRLVALFPNPASTCVTVQASSPIKLIVAFNSAGVRMADIREPGSSTVIDIASWPRDTYLVTVRTDRGTVTKKLVVN